MRKTLQGLKRARLYRRNAACFLLMLICVLLVGCASGARSMEAQSGPDLAGGTDGVSPQPEDPPVPAAAPPSANLATVVQTDAAPTEDPEPSSENEDPEPPTEEQSPEPPAESQDPESSVENEDPEPPVENEDPEIPAESENPELPVENTEEPAPQPEDPAQAAQEKLDEQVQKALDGIIADGMTKLEQAKAVWDFTKNGISYTGTSEKSDWTVGAYEGLTTRRGDCFTYYAVSRALLTALGIDNLEVRRVGGVTSHYWNLVNCGDGWYHFDATPRSSKLPYFVSFMFTDEEAADYTARVGGGREYYTFDGSLYPERGTGDPAAELSD